MFAEKKHCKCFVWFGSWLNIYSVSQCPPHVCRCAGESLPVFKCVLCSVFFFYPLHTRNTSSPLPPSFFIPALVFLTKNRWWSERSRRNNNLSASFRAHFHWAHWALCGEAARKCGGRGRSEMTGCQVTRHTSQPYKHYLTDYPKVWRWVSLAICCRNRCHLHRQGGLHHPDQEAHHEVAEGQVAGPGQQGRQAHAVQRDLRPQHQGAHNVQKRPSCHFAPPLTWVIRWCLIPPKDLHLRDEGHKSGRGRCRQLQVWGDGQGQVWQLHLRDLSGGWVSGKKMTVPPGHRPPGFHARRRHDGDPNVLLLSLQPRNRGSKLIFCLLSRGRKCSGGGVKCYNKGAMKKCMKKSIV